MSFGQRLSVKRKQKGLSQEDLASLIGTRKNMISRYERDEISPSIDVAAKLANSLDASLDDLVLGFIPDYSGKKLDDVFLEVNNLPEVDQKHIVAVVEAFITKSKVQQLLKG